MSYLDEIFQLVRKAAPSSIWSLGVELARKGSVVCQANTSTEIILQVTSPGRGVSATVKLWPDDEDWHCDCGRALPACEHTAASVIALKRLAEAASEQGGHLSVVTASGARMRYQFQRQAGALILERELEIGETRIPILKSLHSTALPAGMSFNPTKADATIDSLLANTVGKVPPAPVLFPLLRLLQGSPQVSLDGQPVSIGREVAPYQATVEDEGTRDVRLKLTAVPQVKEIFSNGAVLTEDGICPADEPELEPNEKKLLAGKVFTPAEFIELASRVLPVLERKLKIEIRTSRLPTTTGEDVPRIVIETSGNQEVLHVLPLIFYGNPAYARLDGEKITLLSSSNRVPERNPAAEQRLMRDFSARTGLSVGRRMEYRSETAISMAKRLESLGFPIGGDALAAFRPMPPLLAAISVTEDGFEIGFKTMQGDALADTGRVLQAWQDGMQRVSLLNGGWAPIPKEWLDLHGHTILELLESKQKGRVPVHARLELARLCETLDTPCPPDLSALYQSLKQLERIPHAALPRDLTASLRAYQKQGVDWLQFLKSHGLGALLADDMGLGKTLQTICVLKGPSLVVAPTSVLSNWQKEIRRFRPDLKVVLYHGAGRKLDPNADVTLTSYALLRLDLEALKAVHWDTVVLDEAQNIKNSESQSARSAFDLDAKFRLALTGTPIENRIEDLWSLFHFTNPGLLGTRTGFSERYAIALAGQAKSLHAKIKPFVLRRLKREVAPELPARTELVLSFELDDNERPLYEAVLAATRKDVLEQLQTGSGVMAALEALLRLRQAACHPGLLPGKSAPDSSKLKLLREKLEELVSEGHKALIFSQWTSLLDLLEPTLHSSGMPFLRIDGSTAASNRAEIVDNFQSPDGPPLLLMTLKSGGVGLNLTAADHVFLLDPWWNPAAEDQAADRAHRIGQDRPVFIHRLVAQNTVEEKILELQQSKRQTAATALAGAGGASITREDLLGLLT